jgi:hypothetical protein
MIEDLVGQAAAKAGLSPEQTRTALSAALSLIRKHGDPAMVAALLGAIPGAEAMAQKGDALSQTGPGLMSGLLKGVGGGAMSDAMAMGPRLAREGVTTSDMQTILPVAMAWVREKTGRDLLRDVLASIPGIGKLLVGG